MANQSVETKAAGDDVSDIECAHYWMIETPNGEKSTGTCKHCGTSREFFNSVQRRVMTRATARPQARSSSSSS